MSSFSRASSILPIASALACFNPTSGTEPAQTVFRAPLIVGASVSADWNAESPGKRLAKRHGGDARTIAQGGHTGSAMIREIDSGSFADRSIVIGVDFLFWDSTHANTEPSIAALRSLLGQAASLGLPIVIGDIPELLPGRQVSRVKLNAAIHSLCGSTPRCQVLEQDKLHRKILSDGFLEYQGRRYTIQDLLPDGLHLSETAGEFLADEIARLVG